MNRHETRIERRIRLWIAQQEMEIGRYRGKGADARPGAPGVRMPPAVDLPERERWRY
jgi:hypothetical protein